MKFIYTIKQKNPFLLQMLKITFHLIWHALCWRRKIFPPIIASLRQTAAKLGLIWHEWNIIERKSTTNGMKIDAIDVERKTHKDITGTRLNDKQKLKLVSSFWIPHFKFSWMYEEKLFLRDKTIDPIGLMFREA